MVPFYPTREGIIRAKANQGKVGMYGFEPSACKWMDMNLCDVS